MKLNNLKRMVVGVGAAAMMMSAMAVGADAAASDWTDGAKVTVNMYIPKANNPVMKIWNAYFTNPKIPPYQAVSGNATVHVEGEKAYVTIPLENPGFSIYTVNDAKDLKLDDAGISLETSKCITGSNECTDDASHLGDRYFSLVYDITNFTGTTVNEQLTYIKSHAKANFQLGAIKKDNDSVQTTPVKVEMNLAAARK